MAGVQVCADGEGGPYHVVLQCRAADGCPGYQVMMHELARK